MPDEEAPIARPSWSGTITFGLVSVPVNLFPANRSSRASLRTLGPDGMPLRRRYYSEEKGKNLDAEETARGFELEDGRTILVADEELERIAPEKTRDIDLRLFVKKDDISPLYFERAYFLTPAGSSTKAYRLLARTMEEKDRAGIATFVMRGKEYLVAILASNGILRAETLRFHDEVRSPEDVGLPEKGEADASAVKKFSDAIRQNEAPTLTAEDTLDPDNRKLLELVERKQSRNEDIVQAPEAPAEEGAEVIDIMEVLKRALGEPAARPGPKAAAPRAAAGGGLEELTREELYDRAKALDIPGRSGMTKEQLIQAVRRAA